MNNAILEQENLGKEQGQERGKMDSYENGFREGVQDGLKKGILISFLEVSKMFIEQDIRLKANKALKKISYKDFRSMSLEDLENYQKVLTSNIKNIYK